MLYTHENSLIDIMIVMYNRILNDSYMVSVNIEPIWLSRTGSNITLIKV